MYSAYGEFLSLANLDAAVDGLYKAYLECVLIDFRIKSAPPKTDSPQIPYWAAVYDFRKRNLDPFTLRKGQTRLTDAERNLIEDEQTSDEIERFNQAKDYLYWFDLRARYWENTLIDEQIKAIAAAPEDVLKLEQAALVLQGRLETALKSSCWPLLDSVVSYFEKAKRDSIRPEVDGSRGSDGERFPPESTG